MTLQIIILALVQGLTEFLPVSSSAHLILASRVFGWSDQGLVVDVAIHLGTLFAVLFYFRKDLVSMLAGAMGRPRGSDATGSRAMLWNIIVASVPVIVVGAMLHEWVEVSLRNPHVIAGATLFFGVLLWIGDARFPSGLQMRNMHRRPAVWIGLAQVLALIPGASRSGVTMTMGRMLGFSAETAARFSFLLSIPVLAAAGGYGLLRMLEGEIGLNWSAFVLAVLCSAVAGWVCIAAFLALLNRVGLMPFIIYRMLLGVVLVLFLL